MTGDQIASSKTVMTIEPETGVAMTTTSSPNRYVEVEGKKVLTLIDGTLSINAATVTDNVKAYKALSVRLHFIRVRAPWAGSFIGILALLAGLLLTRSARTTKPRSGTGATITRRTRWR